VEELCASYPFGPEPLPLVPQLTAFLKEASAFLKPDVVAAVVERLKTDWRLRIATPELFATVQPDGWAPAQLAVKYRWTGKPAAAIRLRCNAPWPVAGKLRFKVMRPTGQVQHSEVEVPDDFVLNTPKVERYNFLALNTNAYRVTPDRQAAQWRRSGATPAGPVVLRNDSRR
jgi:hypothetical protein